MRKVNEENEKETQESDRERGIERRVGEMDRKRDRTYREERKKGDE